MSALKNVLKSYPNLKQTFDELNEMEENGSVLQNPTNEDVSVEHPPLYHSLDILSESSEEDTEEESEVEDLGEMENVSVDDEKDQSEEIDDDNFHVSFNEKLPWTAMTQKTVNGQLRVNMSAPEGLNELQFEQWVSSIENLMSLSKSLRLHSAELSIIEDGIQIDEKLNSCLSRTSCFKALPEFKDPAGEKKGSENLTIASSPSGSCESESSDLSGLPSLHQEEIKNMIEEKFILRSEDKKCKEYHTSFAELFGSKEAALAFLNGNPVGIDELVCAGLKRRGIFNRMRIKYVLKPIFK
ncbi:phosphoprotein [Vesiculovirus jurona]|nr:phosphoprotein [Vesiculovirus jurona]AJR28386.1 phosphoprotein [Vesiculovirus jurona]